MRVAAGGEGDDVGWAQHSCFLSHSHMLLVLMLSMSTCNTLVPSLTYNNTPADAVGVDAVVIDGCNTRTLSHTHSQMLLGPDALLDREREAQARRVRCLEEGAASVMESRGEEGGLSSHSSGSVVRGGWVWECVCVCEW